MRVGVKLLEFYNVMFPDVKDSEDAAIAISERAFGSLQRQRQQRPVTILTLGPPTNIARAIQNHKELFNYSPPSSFNSHNIEHIYLMDGELTNRQLDLNFRTDRASARIVLEANIPKTSIPIQTCAQVSMTEFWLNS